MTDSEKLKLILILCSICTEQDTNELKSFIKVSARYVDTTDFNKILRKAMKIMEYKRCGQISCPDWLMNELFKLYKFDLHN
jgi:hypothetical protein